MAKVETESMQKWSNRMSLLNDKALEILETMESNLKDLNNYWDGNSSNSFVNATLSLTTKVKGYHNDMKKMPSILLETINKMNNQ